MKEHFWTIIRALVLLSSLFCLIYMSFTAKIQLRYSKHDESLFRYPAATYQLLTIGGESGGYGSSHGET